MAGEFEPYAGDGEIADAADAATYERTTTRPRPISASRRAVSCSSAASLIRCSRAASASPLDASVGSGLTSR